MMMTIAKNAGTLQDLWQAYAIESERQRLRIAKLRSEFKNIPNGQHSARGYQLRSRLAVMYRQLEELRETERTLRLYYRYSDCDLGEGRAGKLAEQS